MQADVGVGMHSGFLSDLREVGPANRDEVGAELALAQEKAGVFPFVVQAFDQLVHCRAASAGGKDERLGQSTDLSHRRNGCDALWQNNGQFPLKKATIANAKNGFSTRRVNGT